MSGAERGVRADCVGDGFPDSAGATSGLHIPPGPHNVWQPLPCPFCGSANVDVSRIGNYREQTAMVTCMNCLAVGPTTAEQRIGEAVYRWNTRQAGDVAAGESPAAEDVTFFLDP